MNITPEEAEFVPTPRWPVKRLSELLDLRYTGDRWVEPCVGEGDLVRAFNDVRPGLRWTANDIRPVPPRVFYQRLLQLDLTRQQLPGRYHVGATNPPFSKALPIARQLVERCDLTVMFMPAAWPSCNDRYDFIREVSCDVLVLPDRVWENVRDMAFFLFPSQGLGYRVLNRTPLEERKRDAAELDGRRYRGPEQLALEVSA